MKTQFKPTLSYVLILSLISGPSAHAQTSSWGRATDTAYRAYDTVSAAASTVLDYVVPPVNNSFDALFERSSCAAYDERQASIAIARAGAICDTAAASSTGNQIVNLANVSNVVNEQTDDQVFTALGRLHARENTCAADFAKEVVASAATTTASQTPAVIDIIVDNVKKMRTARQRLQRATQRLATDMTLSTRTCPLDLEQLKRDLQTIDPSYALCEEIISSRTDYNVHLAAIPLAGSPDVFQLIDRYSNTPDGLNRDGFFELAEQFTQFSGLERDLKKDVVEAYGKADRRHRANATELNSKAQQGGASFGRGERYELLANPDVNESFFARGEDRKNLEGVMCRAQGRYGRGVDARNTGLALIAFGISAGVAVAYRAASISATVAQGANALHQAGRISTATRRILQLSAASALGMDVASTLSSISTDCGQQGRIKATGRNGECVSAPTVAEVIETKCVINKLALAGIVVAPLAVVAPAAIRATSQATSEVAGAARRLAGDAATRVKIDRAISAARTARTAADRSKAIREIVEQFRSPEDLERTVARLRADNRGSAAWQSDLIDEVRLAGGKTDIISNESNPLNQVITRVQTADVDAVASALSRATQQERRDPAVLRARILEQCGEGAVR